MKVVMRKCYLMWAGKIIVYHSEPGVTKSVYRKPTVFVLKKESKWKAKRKLCLNYCFYFYSSFHNYFLLFSSWIPITGHEKLRIGKCSFCLSLKHIKLFSREGFLRVVWWEYSSSPIWSPILKPEVCNPEWWNPECWGTILYKSTQKSHYKE